MKKPTIEYAMELLSYIPKRPDYHTWIRVISSIANVFDERTALKILLNHFKDESPNETENKIRKRLNSVSFGTLVYYAEQNGYNVKKKAKINKGNKQSFFHLKKATTNYLEMLKPLNTDLKPKLLNLVNKPPENDKRTYLLSINKSVFNKNLNPQTKDQYLNYYKFNNDFRNVILTKGGIIEAVSKGFSICCGHFNGSKTNENFVKTNLFAIDVDGGLTIEQALEIKEIQKALFLYTTVSHTESINRFRILFGIDRTLYKNDFQDLTELIKYYIDIFKADSSCSNVSRGYYGNNKTQIIDLQTGELTNYGLVDFAGAL